MEKEEIFRLEDQSGDGVADMAQLYTRDFNSEVTDVAGALMAFNENVFVGLGPDMWRLWDENGDGQADKKESISHGYNVHIGFGGHGMSGLRVGPDGRIYWGIGDIGSYIVDKQERSGTMPIRELFSGPIPTVLILKYLLVGSEIHTNLFLTNMET